MIQRVLQIEGVKLIVSHILLGGGSFIQNVTGLLKETKL